MNDVLAQLANEAREVTAPVAQSPFQVQYPAEFNWIQTSSFDFAVKMREVLRLWHRLTSNQLAAVQRCMQSERSYKERQAIQGYTREQTAVTLNRAAQEAPQGLDLSSLPEGMYAVPGGDTRLKVRVAKPEGKWNGWVFVSDGAEYGQQRRYGAQRPGGKYEGQIREQLAIIASNPEAASAAYGKITGRCGCCGRKLENEVSVARGIGPICAEQNGW